MKGISIKKNLSAFIAKATESDESKLKYSKTGFLISSALSVVSGMVMLQGGVLASSDIVTAFAGVFCLAFASFAGFFAVTISENNRIIANQKLNSAVHNRVQPTIEDVV